MNVYNNEKGDSKMECYFPVDKIDKGNQVAIWGYGEIGEKIIEWNERFQYCNIVCVFEEKQEKKIPYGIRKYKIGEWKKVDFNKLIITITRNLSKIKDLIFENGIPLNKCIFLAEGNYIIDGKIYYSQNGEDILLCSLLRKLGIEEVSFCDIGANDPVRLNNTYLIEKEFKIKKGVLIEPNSILADRISKKRENVTCVNCGVTDSVEREILKFYVMNVDVLSSFSEETVREYEKLGYKLEREEKIDCININEIFENYFTDVDVLSIDTEGLDMKILESIDYKRHRPTIICAETSGFRKGKDKDGIDIIEKLLQKGYIVYADTFLNTIFVDKRPIEEKFCKNIRTIYPIV